MGKETEISQRICKIRELFCDGNNNQFAGLIGLSPQNASGICRGTKPAGKDTQDKILRAFPRINRAWLVLGEGDMLKPEPTISTDVITNTAFGNNNVQGKEIMPVSERAADIDRLIALLENKDRQIDRLITLLEKKYATE
ncbi:MAG: hypothetical protein IJU90_08910 [Bacteroidales bacterium]|nr:hypothetical protein [Bacteroidales bacterium]